MGDPEKKPPKVSWESWVERKIRESMERGEFDNLPGTGKPIPDLARPYDELWWLRKKLREERFSIEPLTITLRRELDETRAGIAAADRAGKYYGVADSGHIVIDEVAGYLITMAFLPRGLFAALTGFVLFRICDVLKPWPANFFDRDPRWKNGAGVVLDDVFAGVWACALTWTAVWVRQRYL